MNASITHTPAMAPYIVIYDGTCNLCVNLVKALEMVDRGEQFQYAAMQETEVLQVFNIQPQDCEMGMILIDAQQPDRRWQGSAAAEEIGQLLPLGNGFVMAYRALPGLKWGGDRLYEQIRDNRYALFGRREEVYTSAYPACESEACKAHFSTTQAGDR